MEKLWKEQAKEIFKGITDIPEGEWSHASRFLLFRHYRKKEHLLEAGVLADYSFLILGGMVRIYYLTESGKEYNRRFAAEREFCGSVSSVIAGLPSRFYIQALEDVDAVLLPRRAVNALYDRHRCWERLGRIMAEGAMISFEVKEGEILDSLEERYLRLFRQNPSLFRRIPQYHIASYLGITHVSLSRLRKRLRDREGTGIEGPGSEPSPDFLKKIGNVNPG